jgi:hypothetical protein
MMATRFNDRSSQRFGISGLSTGYDGDVDTLGLTIPSVGIEDADIALFNLFDKQIRFQVSTSDSNRKEIRIVPVIFAAGEKWALAKRKKGLRDKNGLLILPLITVVRTTIQQSANDDITGRGINQQTGEITIQRRLNNSDRSYQRLINRLLLGDQTNLAVSPTTANENNNLVTDRLIGQLANDPTVIDGGLLASNRKNNIYETLVIPAPQFYTAMYDVTFWAQYTVQMSQMIELAMASFLPQGNAWRIETPKGYWFVATVDNNTFSAENNADDMSSEERMIKYRFTVKVPAYIMASSIPGAPLPIKRYVSSPSVSFDVSLGDDSEMLDERGINDPFLGADDPTLPLADGKSRRRDQRNVGGTQLYSGIDSEHDPALLALPRGRKPGRFKKFIGVGNDGQQQTRLARVVATNRHSGETVFAAGTDLSGLTIIIDE